MMELDDLLLAPSVPSRSPDELLGDSETRLALGPAFWMRERMVMMAALDWDE
jgi:hypothetical protein